MICKGKRINAKMLQRQIDALPGQNEPAILHAESMRVSSDIGSESFAQGISPAQSGHYHQTMQIAAMR
jgi:hypothetical protein